ncbi:uncharacterized protein TRAVEDRAFT_131812 [Trametes versicolor FP-101664 SS1]|uniref:uncharacterized protein n=1 Tax=Trametes versicolor (strain FP-101664) TaxID=717944 RepID=UPI00046221E8|nr:uncharacterized protein TRAVEDRAFT_131812 [Trametes versicolor FP-101664 SS1]EIW54228.1 hypothetical protein TRAVEDRAFT_131812 [Trametes versicolor FP-101664 SS1]
MEEQRGAGRGSYIWGRSVHNTRIERLWYDVTHGFGQKWKNFFIDLEANHGLNPQIPEHIWLLHYLFLPAINQDADDWVESWNSHVLQIRGERNRSPRDIFLFSMVQDGPRGLTLAQAPTDEDIGDPATYGIDWTVADDPVLMQHLLDNNPQDWEDENPFRVGGGPTRLSEVLCVPPNCPLNADELQSLQDALRMQVDLTLRSMDIRRIVWQTAFHLCDEILSQRR